MGRLTFTWDGHEMIESKAPPFRMKTFVRHNYLFLITLIVMLGAWLHWVGFEHLVDKFFYRWCYRVWIGG